VFKYVGSALEVIFYIISSIALNRKGVLRMGGRRSTEAHLKKKKLSCSLKGSHGSLVHVLFTDMVDSVLH
jgi:hypothetical protein